MSDRLLFSLCQALWRIIFFAGENGAFGGLAILQLISTLTNKLYRISLLKFKAGFVAKMFRDLSPSVHNFF